MHRVKCKFRKVCGRFIIHLDQITKALIKHVIVKIISNTRKIFTPLSHRSSTRFSIHCHQCDFLLHGCFQRDLHWSSKCMRAIFERVLSHQGFRLTAWLHSGADIFPPISALVDQVPLVSAMANFAIRQHSCYF